MVHKVELDVGYAPLKLHEWLPVRLMKSPSFQAHQLLNAHAKQCLLRVAHPAAERQVRTFDASVFCRQKQPLNGVSTG
ncbi:hypothetical protein D3C72_2376800 [compost metagenome]